VRRPAHVQQQTVTAPGAQIMEYEDDFERETQPSGDLNPPPRKPPTAVAAQTPAPAPGERPIAVRAWRRRQSSIAARVSGLFDVLDMIGDTIAESVGLRGRS
jgi:hypothetical protein